MMKRVAEWYPVIAMVAIDTAFAVSNILLKKVVNDGIDHLVFITYRQSVSAIFLFPLAYFLERGSRPKLTFSILCNLFMSAGICDTISVPPRHRKYVCDLLMCLPQLGSGLDIYNGLAFRGEHKMQQRERQGGGRTSVRWWRGLTDRLQRGTVVPLPSRCSANGTTCVGASGRWEGEVDDWLSCLVCRDNLLVVLVPSPITYRQEISVPILHHRDHGLVQRHAGGRLDFFHRQASIRLGPGEQIQYLNSPVFGSGMCFVGMSWCVKKRGPVFTAAFSPLVQIMAALYDVPVMHEQLHLGSVIGSVIVIVGLYIMLWGKDREMSHNQQKLVEGNEEMKISVP
ncbi:hypothetical protein SASPL_133038 [Salvia splendens]|uniref:WAT1-related protein n=1 Tax=Salvia splendens TaxID=180675 RepID=A0A8X8ZIQ8_SALSN|nr:hypothetical protein SASPL_133038 [Salvia splendens]